MHSKAKPPTKAERARMAKIVSLGCVACIRGKYACPLPVEIHHLLDGGVRRGHAFTVGLCSWHHRGVACNPGFGLMGKDKAVFFGPGGMTPAFGPSLANGSRPFRQHFGSDDDLLAFQNALLEREDLL